uniref:TM158 protein n=1 Tax=Macrostomum lignano TaxID=282301 RepID=A0A1I8HK24_9PLAT
GLVDAWLLSGSSNRRIVRRLSLQLLLATSATCVAALSGGELPPGATGTLGRVIAKESWLTAGCSQTRQRDCLCRPDNRRRYPLPGSPGGSRDSSGRNGGQCGTTGFSVILGSAFPDVFKAVFVLVALVIALISCRGLCILVQNRFGDSPAAWDSIYRPGPGEATDDAESRPVRDGRMRKLLAQSAAPCWTSTPTQPAAS